MLQSAKVRALVVGTVALFAFGAIYLEPLDRHLQGDAEAFLAVSAVVILTSGWFTAPKRLMSWLVWGTLSPLAASIFGYTTILVIFYASRGYFGPDFTPGSWIFFVFVAPYVACKMWVLSIGLPILGAAISILLPPKADKLTVDADQPRA